MALKLGDFVPPVLMKAVSKVSSLKSKHRLFEGDDEMFKRLTSRAKIYGEYGMGASTEWVLRNTSADVLAVDTAEAWVSQVSASNPETGRLRATWVDVGPVVDWGRPRSYSNRNRFFDYVDALWADGSRPDVVLIDGRFRVACCFHSILKAAPGTKIIFDDYINRPLHHVVEEVIPVSDRCGRQVLFIVPEQLDRLSVTTLRDQFLFVMD